MVARGYYLAEGYIHPETKAMTIYVWAIVAPLWKIFMGSSDLIILLMAVDRFRVMKNIDQIGLINRVSTGIGNLIEPPPPGPQAHTFIHASMMLSFGCFM